ncbi:MAG: NB-ARC domain-containing protein [Cyanobacteria bacterium J06621_8]
MNENNSQESVPKSEKASNTNQFHSGDGDNVGRDKITVNINLDSESSGKQSSLNKPSNLNRRGSENFVGREQQLKKLHQLLQENEQVSISAIAGMGGVGKTELALQYAQSCQNEYPGSLCWFSVRGENLGTQIIEYASTYLRISVPDEL